MTGWKKRFTRWIIRGIIGTWLSFRLAFLQLEYWLLKRFKRSWTRLVLWGQMPRARHALAGLPALLLLGLLTWAIILDRSSPYHTREGLYEKAATAAVAAGDNARARVAYERLSTYWPDRPAHRLGLAMCLLRQGEVERGETLLAQLAPGDRIGYQPAHLIVAGRLLQAPSPDRLVSAERHLLRATGEIRPGAQVRSTPLTLVGAQAHLLLGQLYLQNQRALLAEQHLKEAEARLPEARLLLAGLHRRQGRQEEATRLASLALGSYQQVARDAPDQVSGWIGQAEALALLDRHAEVVETLQNALRHREDPLVRNRLATAFAVWSDEKSLTPAGRVELLSQGLQVDPNSGLLLQKLIAASQLGDNTAARELLQKVMAQGARSPVLHLALGMDAQKRGKAEQARHHLTQAFQMDPKAAVVANNLAWVLTHSEKPEPERALELIDEVVKRHPAEPQFRDTRGRVLAKLGRWKEALADLQSCLPAMANNSDLHRALAEVYRKLDLPELAKAHERLQTATR